MSFSCMCIKKKKTKFTFAKKAISLLLGKTQEKSDLVS